MLSFIEQSKVGVFCVSKANILKFKRKKCPANNTIVMDTSALLKYATWYTRGVRDEDIDTVRQYNLVCPQSLLKRLNQMYILLILTKTFSIYI